VQFSVHCGTLPPSDANLTSSVLTATVGPGVEFPAIGSSASPGWNVINANVDVSDAAIDISYVGPATASSGAFNGYVFHYVSQVGGGALPNIINAELAPETTFSPGSVNVKVGDAATVWIDVSGVDIAAGSEIAVSLTLQ
jgi:hypothetical protein